MKLQVNIGRIEEIVGDDTEMKISLLGMFVETCDRIIAKMEKLLGSKDQKAWDEVCHELKGAALNLGFEDLGNYCKTIEYVELNESQKKVAIDIIRSSRNSVEELKQSLE